MGNVASNQLSAGAVIPVHQLETVTGPSLSLPAAGTTHDRHQELADAGITEVAFSRSHFHSHADDQWSVDEVLEIQRSRGTWGVS